jgi:hypothetical protein
VWLGSVPLVLLVDQGRRVFWTCLVALVPLIWVLGGYHFWRSVCPLGFFATLAQRLGKAGDRKLGGRWLTQALLFNLLVMGLALAARLLALNGDRWALAGFILGVSLLAAALGFVFRGKTWCNFLCPVGLVEKLYTEPLAGGQDNSQCGACTGCRKACPDIDLEQHYWKEAEQPQRRWAAYAWPGLVLAFYASYWLETGDWRSYFGGAWTLDDAQILGAMGSGLFFAPALPRLVAVPLILLAAAALSTGGFLLVERALGPERRHQSRMLAGFVAFNLFYLFAGQPTLRLAPGWVGLTWWALVLVVSTWMLSRKWARSEQDFVREKFSRRLLKRWKWQDQAGAHRLEDLVVLDAERKRQQEERLEAYRETLSELAREGVMTRERLSVLGTVRAQLRISEAEHEGIVAQLEGAEASLFEGGEEGLQRRQFREALKQALSAATASGAELGQASVRRLGQAHGLEPGEQDALWSELRGDEAALQQLVEADAVALVGLSALELQLEGQDPLAALARDLVREQASVHRLRIESLLRSLGHPVEELEGLLPGEGRAPRPGALLGRALARLQDPGVHDEGLDRLLALRELSLLRGLHSQDLVQLGQLVERRTFQPGEALCQRGELGDRVYVLRTGRVVVQLEAGDRELGPGACIGELAVLDPAPRSATVLALEATEALVLEGDDFRHLGTTRPSLSEGLLRALARRLRELT